VATGEQVVPLFSQVGFSFSSPPGSPPATFSNVVADLALFFSTGAPSPRPVSGSLPAGDLGNFPFGCFGSCVGARATYGVFQWSANAPSIGGFDALGFAYSGSTDVGLNDWVTSGTATIGQYGRPNGIPIPSGAVFYLVSPTNPVPEPQTWVLILFGVGTLAFIARRRRTMVRC